MYQILKVLTHTDSVSLWTPSSWFYDTIYSTHTQVTTATTFPIRSTDSFYANNGGEKIGKHPRTVLHKLFYAQYRITVALDTRYYVWSQVHAACENTKRNYHNVCFTLKCGGICRRKLLRTHAIHCNDFVSHPPEKLVEIMQTDVSCGKFRMTASAAF